MTGRCVPTLASGVKPIVNVLVVNISQPFLARQHAASACSSFDLVMSGSGWC